MFHVEHGRICGQVQGPPFETRRYDLATKAGDRAHESSQGLTVKFRGRVVEKEQQRPLHCRLRRLGRREHHRAGQQFLLPPRHKLARLTLVVTYLEVRAVRTVLGRSRQPFPIKPLLENFQESLFPIPATLVFETNFCAEQRLAVFLERRTCNIERSSPRLIKPLAELDELSVPASHRARRRPRFQSRIALP